MLLVCCRGNAWGIAVGNRSLLHAEYVSCLAIGTLLAVSFDVDVLLAVCVAVQASGVDYEDMLFFDNERWNITGAGVRINTQSKQHVCSALLMLWGLRLSSGSSSRHDGASIALALCMRSRHLLWSMCVQHQWLVQL